MSLVMNSKGNHGDNIQTNISLAIYYRTREITLDIYIFELTSGHNYAIYGDKLLLNVANYRNVLTPKTFAQIKNILYKYGPSGINKADVIFEFYKKRKCVIVIKNYKAYPQPVPVSTKRESAMQRGCRTIYNIVTGTLYEKVPEAVQPPVVHCRRLSSFELEWPQSDSRLSITCNLPTTIRMPNFHERARATSGKPYRPSTTYVTTETPFSQKEWVVP